MFDPIFLFNLCSVNFLPKYRSRNTRRCPGLCECLTICPSSLSSPVLLMSLVSFCFTIFLYVLFDCMMSQSILRCVDCSILSFLSSLMLKNSPQPPPLHLASWLQTHAPSVEATTQSWFWVSVSNLTSDKTLSGKVLQLIDCAHALGPTSAQATDSGSSGKIPRWPRQAITVAWSFLLEAKRFSPRALPEHMRFIFRSPQNRRRGDSALWQSNCLFCVQTQLQRSSRRSFRCSGGILVLFIALVVASLSIPAVDSMPLMSLRLFPAFFHSASRCVAQQAVVECVRNGLVSNNIRKRKERRKERRKEGEWTTTSLVFCKIET